MAARPTGLEHPGGQPTALDWNIWGLAKKQDGGPWTGTSGGPANGPELEHPG